MVKIISSCFCSLVVVQSAMRQVASHLVAVTNKALSNVFGRYSEWSILLSVRLDIGGTGFTDSSH
jgi:hypothetical protein